MLGDSSSPIPHHVATSSAADAEGADAAAPARSKPVAKGKGRGKRPAADTDDADEDKVCVGEQTFCSAVSVRFLFSPCRLSCGVGCQGLTLRIAVLGVELCNAVREERD